MNTRHHPAERNRVFVSGVREVIEDFISNVSGINAHHQNPLCHDDSFPDVMGNDEERTCRRLATLKDLDDFGAQGIGREHIERAERLIQK